MTVGSPPSTTATTEFVVPRSIPITFAMLSVSSLDCLRPRAPTRKGEDGPSPFRGGELQNVDLDRPGLDLLCLRQSDREHPIAIRRLHLVGLHRDRQGEMSLETPVPALAAMEALLTGRLGRRALALQRQHVA